MKEIKLSPEETNETKIVQNMYDDSNRNKRKNVYFIIVRIYSVKDSIRTYFVFANDKDEAREAYSNLFTPMINIKILQVIDLTNKDEIKNDKLLKGMYTDTKSIIYYSDIIHGWSMGFYINPIFEQIERNIPRYQDTVIFSHKAQPADTKVSILDKLFRFDLIRPDHTTITEMIASDKETIKHEIENVRKSIMYDRVELKHIVNIIIDSEDIVNNDLLSIIQHMSTEYRLNHYRMNINFRLFVLWKYSERNPELFLIDFSNPVDYVNKNKYSNSTHIQFIPLESGMLGEHYE